jgi:hypothetical protein
MNIGCTALYPITRFVSPYSCGNYLKAIAEMRSAGFRACEFEKNVDIDLVEYAERICVARDTLARNEMNLSAVIGVINGVFSQEVAVADEYARRFEGLCRLISNFDCAIACICAYMPPEIQEVPGSERASDQSHASSCKSGSSIHPAYGVSPRNSSLG